MDRAIILGTMAEKELEGILTPTAWWSSGELYDTGPETPERIKDFRSELQWENRQEHSSYMTLVRICVETFTPCEEYMPTEDRLRARVAELEAEVQELQARLAKQEGAKG